MIIPSPINSTLELKKNVIIQYIYQLIPFSDQAIKSILSNDPHQSNDVQINHYNNIIGQRYNGIIVKQINIQVTPIFLVNYKSINYKNYRINHQLIDQNYKKLAINLINQLFNHSIN